MEKGIASMLITVLGGLMTLQAQAASVSVMLDRSDNPGLIADGGEYLEVTISDGIGGAIDFSVISLEELHDLEGYVDPLGITAFSFNAGTSGATLGDIVAPAGWDNAIPATAATVELGIGAFGEFDFILTRAAGDAQDPLQFSIVGVAGDTPHDYLASLSIGEAFHGNALFAAQVLGIHVALPGGEEPNNHLYTAAFAGEVVPLPAAAWLFGSALMGLGWIGKKKKPSGHQTAWGGWHVP
jgi:hypothetical protein